MAKLLNYNSEGFCKVASLERSTGLHGGCTHQAVGQTVISAQALFSRMFYFGG